MGRKTIGETEVVDTRTATPSFRLPDVQSMAQAAVDGALAYAAGKARISVEQAIVNLRIGNRTVSGYCRYGLAKQAAEALGTLDENTRVVYLAEYDATADDVYSSETPAPTVHLIVWARRGTEALDALVAAMDRAFAQRYGELTKMPHLEHLLDVHVVDDTEVEQRAGFGAYLSSVHNPPIKIWER